MKRVFLLALALLLCCAGLAEELLLNVGTDEAAEYARLAVVEPAEGFALYSVQADALDENLPFFQYAPTAEAPMQFYTVQRGLGDAQVMAENYRRNIGQYVEVLSMSEVGAHEVNGVPAYSVCIEYRMNTATQVAYLQNALVYLESPYENACIALNAVNAGADESAFGDADAMLEALLAAAEHIRIDDVQEAEQ